MPEMQQFCTENDVQMIHLKVDKMKEDNIPLTYNKTLMALQVKRVLHREKDRLIFEKVYYRSN